MDQSTQHLDVIECIGNGAATLFTTSFLADELMAEHDTDSKGENLIVEKLLFAKKHTWPDSTLV